jgi:uncharacterized protein
MSSSDVVHDVYRCFREGDMKSLLTAMDPGIEWREAEGMPYEPSGRAWIGPDTIKQNLFKKVAVDWKRFVVVPEQFHEAGDTIVVEGRYIADHNGTGKTMDAQFCHVWKVRDGKLVSFQQYVDTAQVQDVMGAREP